MSRWFWSSRVKARWQGEQDVVIAEDAAVMNYSHLYRHYATYASAVNGFSPDSRKMLSLNRKQLYGSLPRIVPPAKEKGLSLGFPKRKKVINGLFTFDEGLQSYLLVRSSFADQDHHLTYHCIQSAVSLC